MLPPRPSCSELKGLNVKKAIRQRHSELRISSFLLCGHWMSDKMVASKPSPTWASKKLKPAESEQSHLISLFLSFLPYFPYPSFPLSFPPFLATSSFLPFTLSFLFLLKRGSSTLKEYHKTTGMLLHVENEYTWT